MKETVVHNKYGLVTYEENDWNGEKTLRFGSVELTKVDKTTFTFNDGESSHIVKIEGTVFTGVKLVVDNLENIQITKPTLWYEYIFALLPFVLVMVWNLVPELYLSLPIVGGAIGGGIAGMLGFVSLTTMKKTDNPLLKIGIGLGFTILTFVICYIVALAILGLLF